MVLWTSSSEIRLGVQEFLPEHLLIGDDSGGRGFLVRALQGQPSAVLLCDLGGLLPEYLTPVASSLSAWQVAGYPMA